MAVATYWRRYGVRSSVRDGPNLPGLRVSGRWWANGVRALRGSGGMMGAAAYNRGSRLVSKEADERMSAVTLRVDRQAYKDEAARLREQIAALDAKEG